MTSPRTTKTTAAASLVDFVRTERRKDCPVCQLSDEIRDQLKEASKKKITMEDRVRWLVEVCGAHVTYEDLRAHNAARHDYA